MTQTQAKQSTRDFYFTIDRTFNAPVNKVWEAWTNEKQLHQWFGPKGHEILENSLDLKVGGIYHYGLRAQEGKPYWGRWEFLEVKEPERLVFLLSFADENADIVRNPWEADWPLLIHSTVTFEETKGQTKVTVIWKPHDAQDTEYECFEKGASSCHAGWSGTFDRLEQLLKEEKA